MFKATRELRAANAVLSGRLSTLDCLYDCMRADLKRLRETVYQVSTNQLCAGQDFQLVLAVLGVKMEVTTVAKTLGSGSQRRLVPDLHNPSDFATQCQIRHLNERIDALENKVKRKKRK